MRTESKAKAEKLKFPIVVMGASGMTVKIRRNASVKNGTEYVSYVVDYNDPIHGRKQISRSTIEAANSAAHEVCNKMLNNEPPPSTVLVNGEQVAYLRALKSLAPTGLHLDQAARDFAEAFAILAGKVTVIEAARAWVDRNGTVAEKITVADAVKRMLAEMETDKKSSQHRIHAGTALKAFSAAFNVNVDTITPDQVNRHLAGLQLATRTKANRRDHIGAFNRWLVLKKFLPKGTDWLEGVTKFSRMKVGEIEIFTPAEMKKLLVAGGEMTVFLALAAFAGIRHATIIRMDWKHIDFESGFIKVPGRIGKNGTRYLIPIHDNLRAWLLPHRKESGTLFPQLADLKRPALYTSSKLIEVAALAGIAWRHNAQRHSFVSYRLAETNDIMKTSRESNNSPAVIAAHYEQAVTPAQAAEWFAIMP